jgi:hypothetical protein
MKLSLLAYLTGTLLSAALALTGWKWGRQLVRPRVVSPEYLRQAGLL